MERTSLLSQFFTTWVLEETWLQTLLLSVHLMLIDELIPFSNPQTHLNTRIFQNSGSWSGMCPHVTTSFIKSMIKCVSPWNNAVVVDWAPAISLPPLPHPAWMADTSTKWITNSYLQAPQLNSSFLFFSVSQLSNFMQTKEITYFALFWEQFIILFLEAVNMFTNTRNLTLLTMPLLQWVDKDCATGMIKAGVTISEVANPLNMLQWQYIIHGHIIKLNRLWPSLKLWIHLNMIQWLYHSLTHNQTLNRTWPSLKLPIHHNIPQWQYPWTHNQTKQNETISEAAHPYEYAPRTIYRCL